MFETLDLVESDNGQASFCGYPALYRVTTYCLDTQHTGCQARLSGHTVGTTGANSPQIQDISISWMEQGNALIGGLWSAISRTFADQERIAEIRRLLAGFLEGESETTQKNINAGGKRAFRPPGPLSGSMAKFSLREPAPQSDAIIPPALVAVLFTRVFRSTRAVPARILHVNAKRTLLHVLEPEPYLLRPDLLLISTMRVRASFQNLALVVGMHRRPVSNTRYHIE